jgi:hypothetical protein
MSTDRFPTHPADKAVLRLAAGLGLAVLAAYGLALPAPYALCVMAVLVLCKPGPPIPLLKGVVMAAVVAALAAAGVLMVPILRHYALAGVALTGALLYAVFRSGRGGANPQTTILAIPVTLIPVAGMAEPALAPMIGVTLALGIGIGVLVSNASHALFREAPVAADLPDRQTAPPAPLTQQAASWMGVRATLVVMPVFVLALTNPALYLAATMKAVALGQQAGSIDARSAGRELVGSTLMGAWMAALAWFGLSLRPNLWMLMLWMMAAALWAGARMFGVNATSSPPSFWRNALVTMLILLGPAIEDSANGKDVFTASATRVALFVAVALYAWATVWALERWRAARSEALPCEHN